MTILGISLRPLNPTAKPSRPPYRVRRTAVFSNDVTREGVLVDWIEREGGRVGHVAISQSEQEGWFLQAASDIPSGTKLITLPGDSTK